MKNEVPKKVHIHEIESPLQSAQYLFRTTPNMQFTFWEEKASFRNGDGRVGQKCTV